MSAIVTTPGQQLSPAASAQLRAALSSSPKFIRAMQLNEMRQLSGIANFIVFVALPAEDGVAQLEPVHADSLPEESSSMSILGALRCVATQSQIGQTEGDIVVGDVKVNFSTMEADRRGEPLVFTTLEFKTLKYLVENPRRVISRGELLNEVWGYNNYPSTRTVDNQVAKLRKKLEVDPAQPVHLRTVYGAGYKFLP